MSTASLQRGLAAARPRSVGDLVVLAAIVVGVPVLVLGMALGGPTVQLLIIAALAVLVAAWVTTVHPRVTLGAFALVLGLVPYAKLPGTEAPLILVLAVGSWVAIAFLPGVRFTIGYPEVLLGIFAAVAAISFLVTSPSADSVLEYVSWLAATSVVVPMRLLTREARRVVVGALVAGAAVAAVAGVLLLRYDPLGYFLARLTVIGYHAGGGNAQYVPGVESNTLRLTGTYVEPNIAGLILAAGVLLAVAAYRGWLRVVLVAVIGAGLALTLSRSALGTVVVALGLVVLLGRGRQRVWLAGTGVAAALAVLATPVLRARIFSSFGEHDTGSQARALAFSDYASSVQGHWLWGLGWDRPEYRSQSIGQTVNFVANAPLLTVYRGGVILGAVAVLILLVLVVRAGLQARAGFEAAVLACGVAGFALVALQLDFPVVIQHPATAVFSVLVGLSIGRPVTDDDVEPAAVQPEGAS
ncbi:O-antigen ligase family protein [Nocardioides jiangxiensis]|uniref:O-antigen ligase-related domain-containing protein n=1 Tax=Nocardioides jiangxiensis TaxID=3064524 RepID=A0ABT9B2C6_9ACTN|nr:O-antigen ligase family protein [Nocardioides sp. WY-20]MDO7869006.1 hypothetical protein [Nocardioides sp. WY-20]